MYQHDRVAQVLAPASATHGQGLQPPPRWCPARSRPMGAPDHRDPREPGDYDLEWEVVLDDGPTTPGHPDDVLTDLTAPAGDGAGSTGRKPRVPFARGTPDMRVPLASHVGANRRLVWTRPVPTASLEGSACRPPPPDDTTPTSPTSPTGALTECPPTMTHVDGRRRRESRPKTPRSTLDLMPKTSARMLRT